MPNPVDPTPIDPITMKILIVADGRLSFDQTDYGLALLVEALREQSGPVATFDVKKGYRRSVTTNMNDSNGPGSDYPDFRFVGDDLGDQYDQVWFFGDQEDKLDATGQPTLRTTQLTGEEAGIISRFMQKGGGVFATGDHESLGSTLGAYLPRVRTMRVWRNGPPENLQDPERNDTINNDVPVGSPPSEQDAFPQKILPRFFPTPSSPQPYPHPLLDGPRGVINVLPDHVHEGVCREPSPTELDEDDYPTRNSFRAVPLIVAYSRSRASTSRPPFGAIGTYDGHTVNLGRIVVDASFHHFLNSNLKPLKEKAGVAYGDIKRYFQNIALWLAPPEKQQIMLARALWTIRSRPIVSEALGDGSISTAADASSLRTAGGVARSELNRLVSPSLSRLWTIEMLTRLNPAFFSLYGYVRPGSAKRNFTVNLEQILDYTVGSVLKGMGSGPGPMAALNLSTSIEELHGAVDAGARNAIDSLSEFVGKETYDELFRS